MACSGKARGFTLVEMVAGMVVMAIALTLMATLLYPLAEQSARGVHRAKAAQLGQAVLAELAGRRLDVATPVGGGAVPSLTCCDDDASVCAGAAPNPGGPASWELLDRFDNYNDTANNLLGSRQYDNFQVAITVTCPAVPQWAGGAKLIQARITAPDGEPFDFAQLRGNF